MRPDKSATGAKNTQASDSTRADEKINPLSPAQEAIAAVPEEQIDFGGEQNQGRSERWHTFESP
jgi:hypothetical protein